MHRETRTALTSARISSATGCTRLHAARCVRAGPVPGTSRSSVRKPFGNESETGSLSPLVPSDNSFPCLTYVRRSPPRSVLMTDSVVVCRRRFLQTLSGRKLIGILRIKFPEYGKQHFIVVKSILKTRTVLWRIVRICIADDNLSPSRPSTWRTLSRVRRSWNDPHVKIATSYCSNHAENGACKNNTARALLFDTRLTETDAIVSFVFKTKYTLVAWRDFIVPRPIPVGSRNVKRTTFLRATIAIWSAESQRNRTDVNFVNFQFWLYISI